MASYGIDFLGKKLTHNCLSRLKSINEYLVLYWGWTGPLPWQTSIMKQTGSCGSLCRVLAIACVPGYDFGKAPGELSGLAQRL